MAEPTFELIDARRRRWRLFSLVLFLVGAASAGVVERRFRELQATLDGLREAHADCEAHRDLLSEVARSSAERSDFEALPPVARVDEAGVTHMVKGSELQVEYDGAGRYLGSQLGASSTAR